MVAVMRLPVGLHPRSHGENVIDDGEARTGGGSSPLKRGKRPASDRGHGTAGLIPAHAGKTVTRFCPRCHARAHPRSRGENDRYGIVTERKEGSSPLTRGKHRSDVPNGNVQGLIPAHAGKTGEGVEAGGGVGAHPRSRGENVVRPGATILEPGSSPLTRGKPVQATAVVIAGRLIPAHAGKTHQTRDMKQRYRAHPRSRGENLITVSVFIVRSGSSPLTRGKRADH